MAKVAMHGEPLCMWEEDTSELLLSISNSMVDLG